jgi:hypothetical protein
MNISRSFTHILDPVRVFIAIFIAACALILVPHPSAYAGPPGPGCHRQCIQWEPGFNCGKNKSCKDRCVAFEVVCKDPGGGTVNSPPSITGSLYCAQPGSNDWCMGGLSLDLDASDPQSFLIDISGTIGADAFACPDGSVECSVPVALEGLGSASYTALSDSGLSASGSLAYKLDAVPPRIVQSITGTSGANGWYVSEVGISAVFSDAVSGIASTAVLVDGNVISLPDTLTADGEYTILFNARDNAGNLSSQSASVKVDRTPPVMDVARDAVVGDRGWYRSDVVYQIASTDIASGAQHVEYRIDGGAWVSTGSTNGGVSFTVSGDGDHTIEYRAFDNAGNVASQSETIRIDETAPSVSFTAPSANTPVDKVINVSGTSSDAASGLDVVEVSVDNGSLWTPVSNGKWMYGWKVSEVSNGSRSILVRARDMAGNVSSASNLSLLVDNIGPNIGISDPWSFDEAGELLVTSNGYDVGSVSITVTNGDGVMMLSEQYTGGGIPSIIWWDGKYNGEQQPAGEYAVTVTACDVHGVCSMAGSAISIPAFYYTFNEPPVQPPQVVSTVPPVIVPTAEPVAQTPNPPVVETPIPPVPQRTIPGMLFFVSIGFGLLFFGNAVLDPRPKALNRLALTLRRNIRQ